MYDYYGDYYARLREAYLKKLEFERQKRALLKKILTPEARQRLANIRYAKPQFAEEVELLLIQLAQQGKLEKIPVDDATLVKLLKSLSRRRETRIRRV